MIPLPANVKLFIGLLLVAGIASLKALVPLEPTWTWALSAVQVLTFLEGFFTVPPAATAKLKAAAAKAAGPAMLVLAVCVVSLTQPACKPSTLPVFEQIVAVVEADLKANVSDAQMASDVCQAMGGTATTDAICSGVAVIIQDAVTLLIDSGVLTGQPLERAKSYMVDHPAVDHHVGANTVAK